MPQHVCHTTSHHIQPCGATPVTSATPCPLGVDTVVPRPLGCPAGLHPLGLHPDHCPRCPLVSSQIIDPEGLSSPTASPHHMSPPRERAGTQSCGLSANVHTLPFAQPRALHIRLTMRGVSSTPSDSLVPYTGFCPISYFLFSIVVNFPFKPF